MRTLLPAVVVLSLCLTPALSFFTSKGISAFPPAEVAAIISLSLSVGAFLWVLGRVLARDWTRGAIFAGFTALPILQYKDWFEPVADILGVAGDPRNVAYVLALAGALVLVVLLRRASEGLVERLLRFSAVLGVALFAYPAITIFLSVIGFEKAEVDAQSEDIRTAEATRPDEPKDIYYLVFDRFQGPAGLRENFGFDNGKFIGELERRGFYVADRSFANYPTTLPSLGSSINGGYLDVSGEVRTDTAVPLHALFERPAVAEFLKDQGYEYALVGSWSGATKKSSYADLNPQFAWSIDLPGADPSLEYFTGVYSVGTMIGEAYDRFGGSSFSQLESHGEIFDSQLDWLRENAKHGSKPRFTFAHLLMPHEPLVFDGQGRPADEELSKDERYVEQLRFTQSRILGLVDRLKAAQPDNPPIIIIAGDEGEYERFGQTDHSAGTSDRVLRKKTNIMAAFYLPGGDPDRLYPRITPVNFFRVVFNEYFGTDLTLKPDRTYTVKDSSHPLDWVDVTDRVRN